MKISGQVFEKSTLLSLPGANINLVEDRKVSTFGTNADNDGRFVLESNSIQPNSLFRISFIGFAPKTFSASELQNKQIYLDEQSTQLDELVINFDKSKNTTDSADAENTTGIDKKSKNKIYLVAGLALAATATFFIVKKYV